MLNRFDAINNLLILFLSLAYDIDSITHKDKRKEYKSKWKEMSKEDLIKECRIFFDENYALSCFRLGEAYTQALYESKNDGEALMYGNSIDEVCGYFGIRT